MRTAWRIIGTIVLILLVAGVFAAGTACAAGAGACTSAGFFFITFDIIEIMTMRRIRTANTTAIPITELIRVDNNSIVNFLSVLCAYIASIVYLTRFSIFASRLSKNFSVTCGNAM